MSFNFKTFLSRMVITSFAIVCLSVAQAPRASFAASSAVVQQSFLRTTLVYVLTKDGNLKNVTNSVYTAQGHTYCECDGDTLSIVLNLNAGTVRDSVGNLIGYTEEVDDSSKPTA